MYLGLDYCLRNNLSWYSTYRECSGIVVSSVPWARLILLWGCLMAAEVWPFQHILQQLSPSLHGANGLKHLHEKCSYLGLLP